MSVPRSFTVFILTAAFTIGCSPTPSSKADEADRGSGSGSGSAQGVNQPRVSPQPRTAGSFQPVVVSNGRVTQMPIGDTLAINGAETVNSGVTLTSPSIATDPLTINNANTLQVGSGVSVAINDTGTYNAADNNSDYALSITNSSVQGIHFPLRSFTAYGVYANVTPSGLTTSEYSAYSFYAAGGQIYGGSGIYLTNNPNSSGSGSSSATIVSGQSITSASTNNINESIENIYTESGSVNDIGINISNASVSNSGGSAVNNYGVFASVSGGSGGSNTAYYASATSGSTANYSFYGAAGELFNAGPNVLAGVTTLGTAGSALTFNTGPSGINGYYGTHYEQTEEFIGGIPVINDFFGSGTSGTGAGFAITSTRPGILELETGTTSAGQAARYAGAGTTHMTGFTDAWYQATIGIPTLSTSSIGFSTVSGMWSTISLSTANGCFFAYDPQNAIANGVNTSNTQNWEAFAIDANASTHQVVLLNGTSQNGAGGAGSITTCTLLQAAISGSSTGWSTLKVVDNGTSNCQFFVNGSLCTTLTAVPATTAGLSAGTFNFANAGTTSSIAELDAHTFAYDIPVRSP
jgi:hypothetical protein